LQQLVATGQVFACTCSRKQIAAESPDGQYPGTCLLKDIPLDTPGASWRLMTMPGTIVRFTDRLAGDYTADLYEVARHFIVRRKEGIPAYHIASLTDDVDFGINLIVRGADLLESTASQLYLAHILQWQSFEEVRFIHHPLLNDGTGTKLSKSAGSTSVLFTRNQGITQDAFLSGFERWQQQIGTIAL
jgi:glutamyl/glutaminyl-tRNA synthetase